MPKKLTDSKCRSLLKEIDKLLNQRTDDTLMKEVIIGRFENVLREILNGDIFDGETPKDVNDVKEHERAIPRERTDYIHRFDPHHIAKDQNEKGVFVLPKSQSQKYDDFKGSKAV